MVRMAAVLFALFGGARQQSAGLRNEPPTVLVITSSTVSPFDDALEGLRNGLGSTVRISTVDLASGAPGSPLTGKDARLAIAVGNNALAVASHAGLPVIATMVLRQDLASLQTRPEGAVVLDLMLPDVWAGLANQFPGTTRVGMIRKVDAGEPADAVLVAQARAAGIALTVVDCPRPDQLLPSFLELKRRVDFVWCPPDATLYNGATVKPLILASIENRLPVAGFSANFVRAGAAAGVYPDYRELGVQTAEMARRFLSGSGNGVGIEWPHKVRVAVNERVIRLLGLRVAKSSAVTPALVVVE